MTNPKYLFVGFGALSLVIACGSSPSSTGDSTGPTTGNKGGGGATTASSTSSTGGDPATTSSSGGGGSSSGNASSTSSSGGSGDAGAGASCVSQTTRDACEQCCYNAHPQGVAVGATAFGRCLCASPGLCATACAQTYCQGKAPQQGDACDQCVQQAGQGQCGTASQQACQGNPDCLAFEQCLKDASCEQKP